MLKYTLSFVLLSLLSGCALMKQEEYTKTTLEAMSKSEQNMARCIDLLDATVDKQSDYIDGLEVKISMLSNDIALLKKGQYQFLAATNITSSKPDPDTSSNLVVADLEPQARSGMVTLGSLEKVYIDIVKSYFIARVDTGATTSSINAVDLQEFERDGKKWVKFHVSQEQAAAEDRKWVEAPIVRRVKIRQSSSNDLERRPVIELWVKIGSVHEKTQFTLSDRTLMDYPILLGREFIQDVALVDVSRDFIESKAPKKHKKNKLNNEN